MRLATDHSVLSVLIFTAAAFSRVSARRNLTYVISRRALVKCAVECSGCRALAVLSVITWPTRAARTGSMEGSGTSHKREMTTTAHYVLRRALLS